ncbi:MAG TPA: ABC transporter permease subunit, partial [Haploplasma sp.]|nr:ABC transporter permease subunit [Haploplasma sp.]
MRNILTIMKKEFKRFFTDKRMLAALILPGIMIFVLYSIMGGVMGDIGSSDDDYKYKVVIEETTEHTKVINHLRDNPVYNVDLDKRLENFEFITYENEVDYKAMVANKELDLFIQYSFDFYEQSILFDPIAGDINPIPTLFIDFNSSNSNSSNAYSAYSTLITMFETDISEKFVSIPVNLADEKSIAATIITSLVPFLLIIFLFTGAMSISIESIAGEKERGTIATLLATPVKRSDIALGKIISLSIISLVSAASSSVGIFLSLPKLMAGIDINFNIYGLGTYILLFIVILTTILIFVVLVSLVSTFAKNVKEASSFSSVLMILNMLVAIPSMTGVVANKTGFYFIPIYNSVQSISSILSNNFNIINFVITILVNLTVVGLGILG